MIIKKRKGSILIVTLFFILMSISFLGFAYDISRIMYYKMYTRNLASVVAMSIVNECGYAYHDKNSGARAIIIYDEESVPVEYKDPITEKNKYTGKYANEDFAWELINRNKKGMDKTYNVTGVYLNPVQSPYSWNIGKDKNRFLKGYTDGINGEVEVLIQAQVEMFFLKSWWGGKYATIQESAVAQPFAIEIEGSFKEKENQKKEYWNYTIN